ncbi:neuronal acetylcholine receptor subunit alpha-6-like [Ptychodera flava]|uniref:neuronal acetylcholine receptor subunit alpha-6-like n=1 Tax=Ptychodera flava TaxID=63121 RepID=UPI00396A6B98
MSLLPSLLLVIIIAVTVLFLNFQAKAERMDEAEDRLHRHLFSNYSKYVRPNENGEPIFYHFGVGLATLHDVDEKQQILKTGGWTVQEWNDNRLQWDPATFNGIYDILVPTEWLWVPSIKIDGIEREQSYLSKSEKASVKYDGMVVHSPGDKFKTSCTLDISLFPFDKQNCELLFYSPYLPNEILTIRAMDGVILRKYNGHVAWDLVNTSSIVRDIFVTEDENVTKTWRSVHYVLHLQRRPLYYIVNIILPSIVQSGLSLFVFWLPCDAGEKLSFSVSILISTSVFSVMVMDIMPVTSEAIPLIMQLIYFNFLIVAVSIVLSIFVLRFHYRPRNKIPMNSTVRRIFLQVLPPYLGLKSFHPKNGVMNDSPPNKNINIEILDVVNEHADEGLNTATGEISESNSVSGMRTTNIQDNSSKELSVTYEEPLSSWKYVALVLDRICFVSLSILYVIGIASILLQA